MGRMSELLAELDGRGFQRWEEVPAAVRQELGLDGLAPTEGLILSAPPIKPNRQTTLPIEGEVDVVHRIITKRGVDNV